LRTREEIREKREEKRDLSLKEVNKL